MVFCGKPSKGCSSCRQRRIKCDQLRPACSQCLRATKICEGYRDQVDLSFRNENEKVAGKVRYPPEPSQVALSRHRKVEVPSQNTIDAEFQKFRTLVLQHTRPIIHAPYIPHQDQGIGFFFTTYVAVLLDYPAGDQQTAISRIVPWSELSTNKSLFNAVSSVGFAGLANVTKDQKYMVLARKRFSETANTINKALKNPDRADLESIFKSVMLLSAFQLVSDRLSNNSWSVHVEGGAAILQIMDMKRSRDIPVRQQLKLCLSIFVDYIAKEQPCSPNVLDLCKTCLESIEPDDKPVISLTQLLVKFTRLNASMKKLVSLDASLFISEAIALDNEMELWEKQLPEAWTYVVISTSPADAVTGFAEELLQYRDLWTARIWNDYRWARISINGLIIRHAFMQDIMLVEDAAKVRRSLQINSEMAKGICNSISVEFKIRHPNAREKGEASALRGNFLILHPLSIAARGIGVSEEVHQFAVNKLMKMGNIMGIRQAADLAEIAIEKRREWKMLLKDWIDYV